jgi:uncharacterized membrane protein
MMPGQTQAQPPAAGESSLNVLLYFGLYTQWYRMEEALKPVAGHALRTLNARSDGADPIPDADGIAAFDIVVMSDVSHGSIQDAGLTAIDSFVREGGGLLVLGGPLTYGEGKYEESIFPRLLPVEGIGRFDLKWEKAGLPLSAGKDHAILKGVDLSAEPFVFWIHEARPNSEGSVILEAGDRPLLVVGHHGKGRVAAFLGTPMGTAGEGQLAFWQWEGWPQLLRNAMLWLAGDS